MFIVRRWKFWRCHVDKTSSAQRVCLFESLELRTLKVRNRIMVSPMCQYCAEQGIPHDWHFIHLGSRAVGGAGIVMAEATAIEPAGRITHFDLGLWNDEQEKAFVRIARFISEQGAIAAIQLAHAGRKASHGRPWENRAVLAPQNGGWDVVGPSPIPWEPGDLVPHELTTSEITDLIHKFQRSAERAFRAGFRLLELHAAHGYLFHSFLSPLSNQRSDGYGGTFEGRVRFLLETVSAVREVWPVELPLFVRLSVTDWADGGWDVSDTVRLAKLLAKQEVDVIDCSSGGTTPAQKIPVQPGYQTPFSELIRREANIRTAAVGLISEPAFAEEIIANEQADLVVLGRMILWNPYWPHHAAKTLKAKVHLPIQYARSDIFN